MSQRRLRALDQRLANVGDAEGGLVRRRDVVVDDGGQVEGDVVLGHADLAGDLDDLDLDVDLDEAFGERVDLDETRVDGAVEAPEFGHETDVTLADGLVRVRAADAARDGTGETDEGAERVDWQETEDVRMCCGGICVVDAMECANLLIDPYQPCEPASSDSPSRVCAYDGCKSSLLGGSTLTTPPF